MTDNMVFGGASLLSDLDLTTQVGTYIEDRPGDEGGGGLNGMIDWNNIYHHSNSVIQSNGYIFIDYNRDGGFDQAWRGDGNNGWETSGNGSDWRRDDGPVAEMENAAKEDKQG
ncbi:MAG TPA: hypothetical protein VGA98_10265 [Allosphingosinicella sp.]|jgi:hypothetical protein